MIKVSNQKCIRNLSDKSMKAAKTRNLIAILAIALTTLLFTALFTIAMTINHSFQESTFRQVGGDYMGAFKYISAEQVQELSADPLVTRWGARLMLGMPSDPPFNKAHVEVSYMDEACAAGSFCTPTEGALPRENTNEIACDTRILQLLGVEPEIGASITLPYKLDSLAAESERVEDMFTLSGWWEYDPACVASQAIVSRSYAESVLAGHGGQNPGSTTGAWTLNIYLKSSMHIEEDMRQILANHGYQIETPDKEGYMQIGVNWGYTGAQLAESADPMVIGAIVGLLLIIMLTGYLIIFNVFQISVTGDIRYYGLLKTIGTTGKQIRHMIRRQAYCLSLVGIPAGLLLGWIVGTVLTPAIMQIMSYSTTHVTVNPLMFLLATLFSLITVRISCARPGRMAAKVSPIEAIRYTEGGKAGKKPKKGVNGGRLGRMALANLGRNKTKTVLTILSLSLAVVLLNATYTFTKSFDMDKYLQSWVVTDFIVGHADYFQVGNGFQSGAQALTEDIIADVDAQGGITESGRIYGKTDGVQEFVTEEWFRQSRSNWISTEALDSMLADKERLSDGRVADNANLYGMEKLPLDQLKLIAGDLAPLHDPTQNAIAAVYSTDDYGQVEEDTQWAKVGDQVTLRYVDEWEYYDTHTGIVSKDSEAIEPGFVGRRPLQYREVTYTVAACVAVPHAISFRFYGSDQFVLNDEVFQRDTGTSYVMNYLINTTDEAEASMEAFLGDYTQNAAPLYDYESKQDYADEFEGMRGMFISLGGALSFIIGVVGVLNFLNAVLTSILARRREFAVLQSIGMTGRQLKAMLIDEGLLYAGFAIGVSVVLSLIVGLLMQRAIGSLFWFFTYQFTILPVVLLAPIFLAISVMMPLLAYWAFARQPIVERLHQAEVGR